MRHPYTIRVVRKMRELTMMTMKIKVVKVFDNNWFSHMRPGLYEVEKIKRIGKLLDRERINFSEWIPFA